MNNKQSIFPDCPVAIFTTTLASSENFTRFKVSIQYQRSDRRHHLPSIDCCEHYFCRHCDHHHHHHHRHHHHHHHCQRVVSLEQRNCQQEIRLGQVTIIFFESRNIAIYDMYLYISWSFPIFHDCLLLWASFYVNNFHFQLEQRLASLELAGEVTCNTGNIAILAIIATCESWQNEFEVVRPTFLTIIRRPERPSSWSPVQRPLRLENPNLFLASQQDEEQPRFCIMVQVSTRQSS